MVSGNDVQNAHFDLYSDPRRYIWSYQDVKTLPNLEIETFKRFPDVDQIGKYLNLMEMSARFVTNDDEDIKLGFQDFKDVLDSIESNEDIYAKLTEVEEALV